MLLRRLLLVFPQSLSGMRLIPNRCLSGATKPAAPVVPELGPFPATPTATEDKSEADDGCYGDHLDFGDDPKDPKLLGYLRWCTPAAKLKVKVISDMFINGCNIRLNGREHAMELFEHWMLAHDKSYPNAAEKSKRFEIFFSKIPYLLKKNFMQLDKPGNLRFGLNIFADLTWKEFDATYLMHPRRKGNKLRKGLFVHRGKQTTR